MEDVCSPTRNSSASNAKVCQSMGGRLWLCPWSSSLEGFIVGFCENRQSRWWLETQEMTIHPEGGDRRGADTSFGFVGNFFS